MPSAYTALLDSCVLYPFPLRDLLVQLATTGLFRARWSSHIHEEWMRAVMTNNPRATAERVERTRVLMDAHAPDCLVSGYEDLINAVSLPDAGDRHVLAAAIVAGADVIVTRNLKHFPASSLARYGIEARHPDEFLADQFTLNPAAVCESVRRTRGRLRNPPFSIDSYLAVLERQDLSKTVALLRHHADAL